MSQFEQNLEKYADIAVKVGVNIQPGQTLVVSGHVHDAPLIRKVVKKAYEAGAKNVIVKWADEEVAKLKYTLAPDDAFEEYPYWNAKEMEELAESNAAFMSIHSANPDLLKDVDPKRIATWSKVAGEAMKKFSDYTQSDKISWTVIGSASQAWADKVFPELPTEERINKLWDAIFKTTRLDQEDPVVAWKEHSQNLWKIADYLTSKNYKELHYRAPGTDLRLGLPEKHIWIGGGGSNEKGNSFMPNMPTEEVFTAPDRNNVNGYVTNTKPLSYGGNLIENFTVTFENGKIVDVKAEKGEEILKALVETDEGSHYLGEVALVPNNSPISQANILFYNTLFDENASNHLAIGSAYAFNIEGGKQMTREELLENGVNNSITHVDFMIGSAEMDIDGITRDGKVEPVFRNGNWAFTI